MAVPGPHREMETAAGDQAGLVVVATFQNLVEAELALSRLNSTGLQAFVHQGATLHLQHLWGPALGGVKLAVARADAAEARAVLGSTAPDSTFDDEALQGGQEIAPMPARDLLALRAWRSAVLGFVVPVVFHAYSVHVLVAFARAPGKASAASWWRVSLAFMLNVGAAAVAWRMFSRHR